MVKFKGTQQPVYKRRDCFRKHWSLKIFLKPKEKEKHIANMVIPGSHPIQAGVTTSPMHDWNTYLARLLFSRSLCRRGKTSRKRSPIFLFNLFSKQMGLKLHRPFQSRVRALLGLWLSPQEQAKYSGIWTYKKQAAEHRYHKSQLAHHSTL